MQIELDDVVEDAVMGNPEAHLWLASEYKKGGIVNKDLRLAWHWTKKASDEGSSFATLMLGFMYYKGQGVTQDFREAARLFKTASKEQSYAWMMLGVMNMDGIGVRKRQKKAFKCFSLASSAFPTNYFCMGLLTERGANGTPDVVKAMKYYEIAADAGHTMAILELAKIHGRGTEVPKDIGKAINYAKRGAELGDTKCKEVFVYLLLKRGDNERDGILAYEYAEELAASGSYFGKLLLGRCYREAFGTEENEELADYWDERAEDDLSEE